MEKERRPRKRCGEIARARARQARQMKMNPVLVGLIFIAAFLSMRTPISFPAIPRSAAGPEGDWPVSDYERGSSAAPIRNRDGNRNEPSILRLLRELRRPAARAAAEQRLLDRVPDAGLRDWVSEQIREDRVTRLRVLTRSAVSDENILLAWHAALDAENADLEAAADEVAAREKALKLLSGIVDKDSNAKRDRRP